MDGWLNEYVSLLSSLLPHTLSAIVLICPLLIECIGIYDEEKNHYAHIICMQRVSLLLIENVLVVECRQEYHFILMCALCVSASCEQFCIFACVRMPMKYSYSTTMFVLCGTVHNTV